jgi:DNA-3-methyladenine glycosylase
MRIRCLSRAELPTETVELARFLIGKTLVRKLDGSQLAGRIVETEAYVIGDAAGHAFRGQTPRNGSLFLDHGRAYVYFVYGCWFMMNVSSETPGIGAGVLLRALEPLGSLRTGLKRKGPSKTAAKRTRNGNYGRALSTRGPGRLCSVMQIDRRHDGLDLCTAGPLWLGSSVQPTGDIGESVRIGLTREVDRLLRFYERGNPFVSGARRLRT